MFSVNIHSNVTKKTWMGGREIKKFKKPRYKTRSRQTGRPLDTRMSNFSIPNIRYNQSPVVTVIFRKTMRFLAAYQSPGKLIR